METKSILETVAEQGPIVLKSAAVYDEPARTHIVRYSEDGKPLWIWVS